MRALLALVFIAVATPGFSCTHNAECPGLERCIKRDNQRVGICMEYGTHLPDPAPPLGDPEDRYCSFDIDCGPGGSCLAVGGLYGTCVGL